MWLQRPGPVGRLAGVALAAALLSMAIPLDRFEDNGNISIQAFALVPWVGTAFWPVGGILLALGLALVMVVAARRRRAEVLVVGAVAAVLLSVTVIAQSQVQLSSERARAAGMGETLTWIDDAVGKNEDVSILWYERPGSDFVPSAARHRIVWLNEFFNRRVGNVYEVGTPMPYAAELEAIPTTIEGGVVRTRDHVRAELGQYVLAPCHVTIEGTPIAHDERTGAVLYRVPEVVRASASEPGSCP
jgi:hypothetical protein